MQIVGPFSASTNFAADLMGVQDERPGTWGLTEAVTQTVQFVPTKPGWRTRIIKVYGDFIAWPKGFIPTKYPDSLQDPKVGYYAGVLWALTTTAAQGSQRVLPGADNCMIYLQNSVRVDTVRAAFSEDVGYGGLLEPDNKLQSTMAVWLNTLGIPVHMEATWVTVYQFEKPNG